MKVAIWPLHHCISASSEVTSTTLAKRNEGARNLAPMGIGFGDNGDLANGGMTSQNLLDLQR